MTAPEIGFDDRRFPHHGVRRAAGDDMALIEDQNVPGESHDYFHDMLDDDDGDAGLVDTAYQRNRLLQFGWREAGKRLIEQQQARLGCKHAGDLQSLAARRAERAGRLFGAQAGHFDDLARLVACIVAIAFARAKRDKL